MLGVVVFMIRNMCWTADGKLKTNLSKKEVTDVLKDPQNLLWVDFAMNLMTKASVFSMKILKFHPLSLQLRWKKPISQRLINWGEYLCLVLRSINPDRT